MNKTLVDKLADRSVIGELKKEIKLPNLDLEVLIMGQKQLYGAPDFPKNLDISDSHMNKGQATMAKELQLMQENQKAK